MENKKSDIGLVGLAVMGENLALNMESKGFQVSVYNRFIPAKEEGIVNRFMHTRGKDKNFLGFENLKEFVDSLSSPRKIFMMIRAGSPVDEMIEQLVPLLDKGDIVIDGGNSNYLDTKRRVSYMESLGFYFIGAGVSGGEEGALHGPAIMPGGSEKAWPEVKPVFESIAAKAEDGTPCCAWIGPGGSGHFVKMVHNGIEYGDMELIAEAYFYMREHYNMNNPEMAEVFESWNQGKLQSYLVEITSEILKHKEANGDYTIDHILDSAGQKGTGKWSVINAMEYGMPLGLIATAVFERNLSARKFIREEAASKYHVCRSSKSKITEEGIQELESSLYASKLVSYAQGFELMSVASENNRWSLNMASIARIWRGGCIIRSAFLNKIAEAYEKNISLENLLLAPYFMKEVERNKHLWKTLISRSIMEELPLPAMASGLEYFVALTTARSGANMIQAQRDYFGAHTFERTDQPRGIFFHINWTGKGGDTQSGSYNA